MCPYNNMYSVCVCVCVCLCVCPYTVHVELPLEPTLDKRSHVKHELILDLSESETLNDRWVVFSPGRETMG